MLENKSTNKQPCLLAKKHRNNPRSLHFIYAMATNVSFMYKFYIPMYGILICMHVYVEFCNLTYLQKEQTASW